MGVLGRKRKGGTEVSLRCTYLMNHYGSIMIGYKLHFIVVACSTLGYSNMYACVRVCLPVSLSLCLFDMTRTNPSMWNLLLFLSSATCRSRSFPSRNVARILSYPCACVYCLQFVSISALSCLSTVVIVTIPVASVFTYITTLSRAGCDRRLSSIRCWT